MKSTNILPLIRYKNLRTKTTVLCKIYRNKIHNKIVLDCTYRGADKSLARPWKETSYSDQDLWRTNSSNIRDVETVMNLIPFFFLFLFFLFYFFLSFLFFFSSSFSSTSVLPHPLLLLHLILLLPVLLPVLPLLILLSLLLLPTVHYTNTYGIQTTAIYCCCLYAVSIGIVL